MDGYVVERDVFAIRVRANFGRKDSMYHVSGQLQGILHSENA
jgi:hypothetical protein